MNKMGLNFEVANKNNILDLTFLFSFIFSFILFFLFIFFPLHFL